MKFFFLLFLPFIQCFNINKIIKPSIVATSIFLNQIEPSNAITHPITHPAIPSIVQPIINQDYFTSSKISVERNNIYFYGEVNSQSCEELRKKLSEMDFNAKLFEIEYNEQAPPINLHIQSTGGSLLDSLYISDFINNLKTPINTYVDGYVASAASLISVMGDKRYMTKNSMILIHQLASGSEGKYQELDDNMKNLQQMMNKVKTIYLTKTKLEYLQLEDILKHDLWLDANTCKKYGLIDEII
tara:strand:- start:1419 stop:2147 length:729 start_codon:yes stop_codon:yes gene_type:complete